MAKKNKKKENKKPIGEIKNSTTISGLFKKCALDDDRPPLPKADIISIRNEFPCLW
jgi:hypothetical protein